MARPNVIFAPDEDSELLDQKYTVSPTAVLDNPRQVAIQRACYCPNYRVERYYYGNLPRFRFWCLPKKKIAECATCPILIPPRMIDTGDWKECERYGVDEMFLLAEEEFDEGD